ncbi:NACHT and WD repeat domain-containing protein [Nocardia sp. NPDC004582]
MSVPPGSGSSRELFAQRLTELWLLAGKLPQKRVAAAANELMGPARVADAKGLGFQRFSDWKNGKTLPKDFDSVWPVLKVLIDRTANARAPVPPELVRPEYWRSLYEQATKWVPQSACPYPGLAAYRSQDADRFFGRDRAIRELTALVHGIDTDGGGIGILVGASGSGKSSLLAAGLIPNLPAGWSNEWCTPADSSGEVWARAEQNHRLLIVDQFEELFASTFGAQDRSEFLDRLVESAAAGTTVIVSVRSDFLARCLETPVLAQALAGGTASEAGVGAADGTGSANAGTIRNCVVLRRPLADELKEVITGPARRAGVELEEKLTELILADLVRLSDNNDVGALPLLSHVMAAVWEKHSGRRLTIAAYVAAGGVASSITHTAELAWKRLDDGQREAAQQLLVAMVAVGDGTRDTRRRLPRTEITAHAVNPGAVEAALDRLAAARLVTVDDGHVTLIHEVVLEAWPRLREWIDADRDALLVRRRMEADAAEWEASDRSAALLYRGTRLVRARGSHPAPDGPSARFLAAAIRARRRRIAAVASSVVVVLVVALGLGGQALARERDRQAEFLTRVLQEADRQQSTDPTLAAQLAVLAYDRKPDHPDVRTRLIASQTLPVAKTFTDQHGGYSGLGYLSDGTLAVAGKDGEVRLWKVDDTGPATLAARLPGPAGRNTQIMRLIVHDSTLITASSDNVIRVYDRSNPTWPQPVSEFEPAGPPTNAALSHDGRTLAVAHASEISLWDISTHTHPVKIPVRAPLLGSPMAIEFTGNDNALITTTQTPRQPTGSAYTTTAWPLDFTRESLQGTTVIVQTDRAMMSVAQTTPLLAVGDMGAGQDSPYPGQSSVKFISLDNPSEPKTVTPSFPVSSAWYLRGLGFGGGDRYFATMSVTGVQLWNLGDRTKPTPLGISLTGAPADCSAPGGHCSGTVMIGAFAPDGRHGAVAFDDGTVQHWSLPTGVLAGQAGQVGSLASAISADGHAMITAVPGQNTHIWDLTNPAAARIAATLPGPDYRGPGGLPPLDPTMSHDGRYVAMMQAGQMRLLDTAAPKDQQLVKTFDGAFGVAFAVDQPVLVVALADPFPHLQVWDYSQPGNLVRKGDGVLRFKTPLASSGIQAAASRDGRVVVSLTDILQVWDPHAANPATPLGAVDSDRLDGSGLAVSPDGKTVAVGWQSGRIRFWDISDPSKITPLAAPLAVTSNLVQSVAYSPSGNLLAVGGNDGTVQLVDTSSSKAPSLNGRSLTTPGEGVWNVAFLDDRHLIAGGRDGALRIWDLDPEHARIRICALTGATIVKRLEAEFPGHRIENPCR